MKKTIAKIMAAAMLVASMPAMVLPTFTVDAAGANGMSVGSIKFNGTYSNGTFKYVDVETTSTNNDGYVIKTTGSSSVDSILKLDAYYGMKTAGTNVWNTNIVYYAEPWSSGYTPESKIANRTLTKGTGSYYNTVEDYVDETDTVTQIATNNDGAVQITFDANKLTTYNNNLLKGTAAKTIKLYPFEVYNTTDLKAVPAIEIQLGETLITGKDTPVNHCSTPDESIQDASVIIKKAGYAVLKSVTENDKKVNMKDKDIEVNTIIVSGIEYPIRKFDDKVLKKGTMKTITAKEIKHLGTGALRNCKKLRKVRMGSAKMRKIHSNAFYDCGKLKNIKINCKNLKAVGSKAFKSLKKNCTISIKAGKTKYNQVVKMIKKSGTDKVKFKRV